MKIFDNLTVIELSSVLAGPLVGTFFAELGARVVKIENQTTQGDITRQWKLPTEDPKAMFSAYYAAANFGKESVLLNIEDKDCLELVYKLCKNADIVICNFKAGAAQKLGVDYPHIKAINPQIIYAELSGFGSNSHRPAFDVVLQAESGFMFMNGQASGQAVKMPVALMDILAAHQLKEGILTALYQRQKTGKGCKVSTSLFDAAVASLANQATNWLMAQHVPQRMGSLHPNIAPYGEQFTTKDNKQLVLAVGNNKQFSQLCQVLHIAHIATQPAFANNTERVKNRQTLAENLQAAILSFNLEELLLELLNAEVPAGAIRNMQEVFELPEAKNMVREELLADGSLAKSVKTVSFLLE